MLKALITRSKDSLKLGIDGLLKIITGLVVIKVITNIGNDSLLANFSQLKMLSALLIAVTSSSFIIGLNKLSIKFEGRKFVASLNVIVLSLSLIALLLIIFFKTSLEEIIGRDTEYFFLLALFLLVGGYFSNYFVGCKVITADNSALAESKLSSTFLSFLIFLIAYVAGIEIWLSLFLYLISYYAILAYKLFDRDEVTKIFSLKYIELRMINEALKIMFVTILSAIIFPSCIVFLRYQLSLEYDWNYVSFWEAEWQLSSLFLLVLSPVLSVVVTTFITAKFKAGLLNRNVLVNVMLLLTSLTLLFSICIYVMRNVLFTNNKDIKARKKYSAMHMLSLISTNSRVTNFFPRRKTSKNTKETIKSNFAKFMSSNQTNNIINKTG